MMDWRLLHNACWEGDARTVEMLLKAGADPNRIAPTTWRQAPLHRTLEFRITHPKNDGHLRVVKLLLAHGADPCLRATALDMTPWELASFGGFVEAEALLREFQEKAEPHPSGMTALWLRAASRLPEDEVLKSLDPVGDLDIIWKKATPLMMAAGHAHHHRVATELLHRGANPNVGVSLLHASCDWHLEHLVTALPFFAHHGWNVNAADEQGQTALHKAAFLGYVGAVTELLALGADRKIKDAHGRTPAEVAAMQKKRSPKILELLGWQAGSK